MEHSSGGISRISGGLCSLGLLSGLLGGLSVLRSAGWKSVQNLVRRVLISSIRM